MALGPFISELNVLLAHEVALTKPATQLITWLAQSAGLGTSDADLNKTLGRLCCSIDSHKLFSCVDDFSAPLLEALARFRITLLLVRTAEPLVLVDADETPFNFFAYETMPRNTVAYSAVDNTGTIIDGVGTKDEWIQHIVRNGFSHPMTRQVITEFVCVVDGDGIEASTLFDITADELAAMGLVLEDGLFMMSDDSGMRTLAEMTAFEDAYGIPSGNRMSELLAVHVAPALLEPSVVIVE